MSDTVFQALITFAGAICTSIITAILGPIVVSYLQRQKPSTESNVSNSETGNPKAETSNAHKLAVGSFALGLLNLFCWLLPIYGLPISIIGLIFGFKGINSSKRGLAITGIVLCIFGFIAGAVNMGLGLYFSLTGQSPY